MKKPKISEAHILAATRQYLQIMGWFVIRHQQGIGCHKGLSDLQAIKNGLTVYIETKAPGGRLSDYQKEFMQRVQGHGGLYVVIDSLDNLQDALETLNVYAKLNLKG